MSARVAGLPDWYYVMVPDRYACAFAVEDERIVDCAPIMKSWLGRSVHDYAVWARPKGAEFKRLR